LLWWRPLARAAPWLRFVAVVRDPRAVVASNLATPWSADQRLPDWGDQLHLAFAVHWSVVQRRTLAMTEMLGRERCLVLRYEDVVADPATARARIGQFVGTPASTEPGAAPAGIVPEWEPWKRDALGPVDSARAGKWREELDAGRAGQVAAVCRSEMRRFGYEQDLPSAAGAATVLGGLGPRAWGRLWRYRRTYEGYARVNDQREL